MSKKELDKRLKELRAMKKERNSIKRKQKEIQELEKELNPSLFGKIKKVAKKLDKRMDKL